MSGPARMAGTADSQAPRMGHLLTLSCVTVNSLDPRRPASFWGRLVERRSDS